MSYEQFWNNLDSIKNENVKKYSHLLKSDCRSSTIFPVFKNKDTDTRLEFLSYWLKKHNNKIGWCMVSADTYLFDAYYISTKVEQIGGDHAF